MKNLTVFLEAIIRMTTHPGLVSIFAEPRKRKFDRDEVIPRRVVWGEKEKKEKGECSRSSESTSPEPDRPSKKAEKEERHLMETQPLGDQKRKMREAMERTREKLRQSKDKEEEEKRAKRRRKEEKKKEKRIKKIFSMFTDDSDDFIEVKSKKLKLIQSTEIIYSGSIQEEKIRQLIRTSTSLYCFLELTKMIFIQEVRKEKSEKETNSTSNLSNLFLKLFYFLTFFFYSDLEMTKRAEDPIQSTYFTHHAVFYKVKFYSYV